MKPDTPLQISDFSDPLLTSAIVENLAEMILLRRHWERAEVHDDPDLLWCLTDIPSPYLNLAIKARLSAEQVDSKIEAILEQCRLRQVPLLWGIDPTSQPAELPAHLLAHGFVHTGDSPCMAMDLNQIAGQIPMPAGLTIRQLEAAEDIQTFFKIVYVLNEAMPTLVGEAFADLHTHLSAYRSAHSIQYFMGYLDGEPIATSMFFLGGGVAGIYYVATLPPARGRGIGTAITLSALHAAREMGYPIAVLQSSEMGYNLYRRLGFQDIFRAGLYYWAGAV